MINLLLFGTSGCHLCDDAHQLIIASVFSKQAKIDCQVIDIIKHEQWLKKYSLRIPVLYHPDSEAELAWPFDAQQLDDFLSEILL